MKIPLAQFEQCANFMLRLLPTVPRMKLCRKYGATRLIQKQYRSMSIRF